MPKYYVESGEIKSVIQAEDEVDACVKSLKKALSVDESLDVGLLFVTSEKGFPLERVPLVLDTHNEKFFDSEEIFSTIDREK